MRLAQTARADADLKVSKVAEAITVTASAPAVLETPKVSTNADAQAGRRRFRSAARSATRIQLAPGVNTNTSVRTTRLSSPAPRRTTTSSWSTASSSTRTCAGSRIPSSSRTPSRRRRSSPAAISAEYGRFTGGVVNTITKSGGNEFSGSLRDQITNPRWTSRTPTQIAAEHATLRHFYNKFYEATLGGFVIKDRLWFFGAGRKTKTDTPSSLRAIPGTGGFSNTFDTTGTDKRYEGKLTGQPSPKHNVTSLVPEGQLDHRPPSRSRRLPTTWRSSAAARTRSTSRRSTTTASSRTTCCSKARGRSCSTASAGATARSSPTSCVARSSATAPTATRATTRRRSAACATRKPATTTAGA